jgi:hypothetical protein
MVPGKLGQQLAHAGVTSPFRQRQRQDGRQPLAARGGNQEALAGFRGTQQRDPRPQRQPPAILDPAGPRAQYRVGQQQEAVFSRQDEVPLDTEPAGELDVQLQVIDVVVRDAAGRVPRGDGLPRPAIGKDLRLPWPRRRNASAAGEFQAEQRIAVEDGQTFAGGRAVAAEDDPGGPLGPRPRLAPPGPGCNDAHVDGIGQWCEKRYANVLPILSKGQRS